MGKTGQYSIVLILLVTALAITGCSTEMENPRGTLSAAELLENPVYDEEVVIFGKVDIMGKVLSPYFELKSGGAKVKVWYSMMVEDNGVPRKTVKAEGIKNGDWIIVTGELKREGKHRVLNDFWASKIEKLEQEPQ